MRIKIVKIEILLSVVVLFFAFGIQESFAQYRGDSYVYDERTFYDYNGTNWNSIIKSENGITITLETNKVEIYSEFEAIRIKANVTNFNSPPILYSSVISSCPHQPYLRLESESKTDFPKDNPFNPLEAELCISRVADAFLLSGKTLAQDIMWKQQVPPGDYVLRALFNGTSARLPIQIIEYGMLEPAIQNTKSMDLSPKKQFEFGISPELIICKEELQLIFKYDNSPACVKQESIAKLFLRGWLSSETILLNIDDFPELIEYSITGAVINDIYVELESGSIIIPVESSQDGYFTIVIPDTYVDPKFYLGEERLYLFINGQETSYTKNIIDEGIVMSFQIPNNAKEIEIHATFSM